MVYSAIITARTLMELFEKLEEEAKDRSYIEFNDIIEGGTLTSGATSYGWNPKWNGEKWECSVNLSESVSKVKAEKKKAAEKRAALKAKRSAAAKKTAATRKAKRIADLKNENFKIRRFLIRVNHRSLDWASMPYLRKRRYSIR